MVSSIGGYGGVSAADLLKQMRQKMFQETDSDGDGSISQSELETQFAKQAEGAKGPRGVGGSQGGQPPSAEQFMQDFDSDGDGSISQTEFDSAFAKLDEQMQSELTAMQGQGAPPPPPPPGQGAAAYGNAGQLGSGSSNTTLADLLKSLTGSDDDEADALQTLLTQLQSGGIAA